LETHSKKWEEEESGIGVTKIQRLGEVICKRVRVNPDNTEVDVAGFTMVADASCRPTQTSSFENEEGALDALEKKFVTKNHW